MATIYQIVVGVDEYPSSLPAVDLGMRESELRNLPVRLVHADPWANHPGWKDQHRELGEATLPAPEQAIHAALGRARTALAVPVTSEIIAGNPVPVMLREAEHASMLVVGHRGSGGFTELLLGSVALQLAEHAPCPVLVARGAGDTDDPVVVGVDGSPVNDPAVAFAFEEASLRGVPLVALHTWIDPVSLGPGDMMPLVYDPTLVEAEERDVLADALRDWRAKYPDVHVRPHLVRSRAAKALIDASAEAQLIVVGRRGRGGFPGLRLGSVTHALLHHSQCPVAVVHHGGPGDTPDTEQR